MEKYMPNPKPKETTLSRASQADAGQQQKECLLIKKGKVIHIKVTPRQADLLQALHRHGVSTIAGLAEHMQCTCPAALSAVRKVQATTGNALITESVVPGVEKRVNVSRLAFDVAPALRAMSYAELQQAISSGKKAAAERVRTPGASKLHLRLAEKALQDKQNEEFLQINAAYLPAQRMADCLGIKLDTLHAMAEIKGVSLNTADQEPRAFEISETMGYIPVGTQIEQWARGTCFHMPSPGVGINRVTRHYAADDD